MSHDHEEGPSRKKARKTSEPSTGAPHYAIGKGEDVEVFKTAFWKHHYDIAENSDVSFKKHALPLARIKKVMKADPDVKMIAAEVPILLSKACELFIAELAGRAWLAAEGGNRKTVGKADVGTAVAGCDSYDFLVDFFESRDADTEPSSSTAIPPRTQKPRKGKKRARSTDSSETPAPDMSRSQSDLLSPAAFPPNFDFNMFSGLSASTNVAQHQVGENDDWSMNLRV